MVEEMNARHVYRMVNNLCDALNGIHYQSILTNIEHISDKCSDIAVYVLERDNSEIFGKEHSYVHELHVSNDAEYKNNYNSNHAKYFDALEAIPVSSAAIVNPNYDDSEPKKDEDKKDKTSESKVKLSRRKSKSDEKK